MTEEVKQNADGSTTVSIKLADMSLNELVMLSQGIGHQIDALREKRAYLSAKIAERLAAGERNGSKERAAAEAEEAAAKAEAAAAEAAQAANPGDATAPGAAITVSAKT